MNKLMAWILNMTKVGKTIKTVQEFLDGKKQIIASIATAVPATALILKNFSEQGTPYLLQVAHTPEFLAASGGWIALFNGFKGEKIRAENAEIMSKLNANQAPAQPPAQ